MELAQDGGGVQARAHVDEGHITVRHERVQMGVRPVRQAEPEIAAADEMDAFDESHGPLSACIPSPGKLGMPRL